MTSDLHAHLLANLQQLAVPRHASWDPVGLMVVRQAIRERLAPLEQLKKHRFTSPGEEAVNLILRLAGRELSIPPSAACRRPSEQSRWFAGGAQNTHGSRSMLKARFP